jgi:hypothetical protein
VTKLSHRTVLVSKDEFVRQYGRTVWERDFGRTDRAIFSILVLQISLFAVLFLNVELVRRCADGTELFWFQKTNK